MQGPMQDLDAGLNAKAWHGASLSSDMTSSCLINRVRIVVEGRYTVQHEHENWARLLTFETKFACSEENVLCWQWRFHWILKWKLHLAKMNNLPDAPWHWRHGAGPPEGWAQCNCIDCIGKGPVLALNNALSLQRRNAYVRPAQLRKLAGPKW